MLVSNTSEHRSEVEHHGSCRSFWRRTVQHCNAGAAAIHVCVNSTVMSATPDSDGVWTSDLDHKVRLEHAQSRVPTARSADDLRIGVPCTPAPG